MNNHHSCKNLQNNPSAQTCMEHYGCIYDNNHLVTLLVNPADGAIVDANKAALDFYGYRLSELRALNIEELKATDKDAMARMAGIPMDIAFVDRVKGGKESNQILMDRHKRADGAAMYVEIHTGMITMLGVNCIYSVIHDVSERVRADLLLKESEERYRNLVELCPDAIIVFREDMVLFANKQSEVLFGLEREQMVGCSLQSFFHRGFLKSRENKVLNYLDQATENTRVEIKAVLNDGRAADLDIVCAPVSFAGVSATQLLLRDVTDSKKEIKRAVQLQERRLAADFPLPDQAGFQKLYVPAGTLSGDFYFFHRIGPDKAIGIIGDVTGKGITAALNISAMRLLFFDSVQEHSNPQDVLRDLNLKIVRHLDEDYIAVCCFLLDFGEGMLTAAAAGINEFDHFTTDGGWTKLQVKGAPVGMFENSKFDSVRVPFSSGDRFCFYTDGLELLEGGETAYWEYEALKRATQDSILQDDCTWLELTIR
ncbi:MAG: putative sensor protein [Paenibacillaceae bacterium]|jgi:PAS domain S-box-containing protein|nr:putative sensor protein [Paenibacillaceae bacterium]